MKLIFKQSAIHEAILNACNVVPQKSVMPIIKNIKLEAKNKEVRIYATDSEIELTIVINENIEVVEEGVVLIDGNKFKSILQEIGEGDYELTEEGNSLILNGLGCEFSINTVNSDEFPIFESFEDEPDFEMPGITLKGMFEKTVFATRDEPSRFQMNGVLLSGKEDQINIVATDTTRLALVNKKIDKPINIDEIDCILSTKFVHTLIKSIKDIPVQIKTEINRIKVKSDNVTISSKLVSGIFPNYKKAIPECDIEIKINRNEFLSALRKATIFTSEITKSIKFSFQNNILLLHSSMPESGEAHISLEIAYEDEPIEMNFNPNYVQEGLKVMTTDDVVINLKNKKRPAVFKGNEDYTYLVMPVLSRE
ncbi:MAG: DNA polymerase III subunit beta [Planctomycetota bacterium]|nr:MAG: DNA polymerase III subunit beta [Planctomycetota bacterium]